MRNLVLPAQEQQLLSFLETEPLLAFDFDGTLAPIVSEAHRAGLRPKTRRLLKALCKLYPVALMTGRSRDDALRLVKGIPFTQVLGNHGAEWGDPERGLDPAETHAMIVRVDAWRERLEAALVGVQGIYIEDKRLSLSLHYRKCHRKEQALELMRQALRGLDGVRYIGGKEVLNVLPREIGGKGESLRELKRLYGKRTALFAGDDLNDEEVFVLPDREGVFKVRVGQSRGSSADFYLPTQQHMDWLLEILIKVARLKRETVLEPVPLIHSRSARAASAARRGGGTGSLSSRRAAS